MKTPIDTCLVIAKRLTAIRLQKTWTREMLAEHANINVHTLKRFERSGQISLERLIAISQALDVEDEAIKLFQPRQRVDTENWEASTLTTRKRGRRTVKNKETPVV